MNFDTLESDAGLEGEETDHVAAGKPDQDHDGGLDFDIDLSMQDEDARSEDRPDSAEFTPPAVSSDMGFDMDSVEPDAVEQDNALDFDLEDLDLGNEEELAADQGDGELTDLDEVSTKLDLARAYIDMGDPDGARNILDEVMEEGSDDQKSEAKGIMEQIS